MPAWLIPLLPKLIDVLTPLIPDPGARDRAVQAILALIQEADRSQIDVNRAEAQHASVFVAGWRPAVGWICAAALAYQFVLSPIALWVGFLVGYPLPKPPSLDEHLWELIFGMLGLGALRSIEKIKNAVR